MDKIPLEVFELILPHVGGRGFVNLRETSKLLKIRADALEMTTKPSLWYRYTFEEFPECIVKSVIGWMSGQAQTIHNIFFWKSVYGAIINSGYCYKTFIVKHVQLSFRVSMVNAMRFIGQQLFLSDYSSISCLVFGGASGPMPITKGQYVDDDVIQDSLVLLDHKSDDIIYKPLNNNDQSDWCVHWCREYAQSVTNLQGWDTILCQWLNYGLTTKKSLFEYGFFQLNEQDKFILDHSFFANIKFGDCSKAPGRITKVKRIDNLLICLAHCVGLFTITMDVDQRTKVLKGSRWQKLCLKHDRNESVTDFDVMGLAFTAITGTGEVYWSNLNEVTHEHLGGNLHLVYELPFPFGSYWTRVAVDINNDLVIAALSQEDGNVALLFGKH